MRFRFIAEHAATFEVAAMCETFGVSRSGYYAWKNRPASDTEQRTELLMIEIEDIHSKRKQAYGSPRVHQELLDRGHSCCVNTVAKLMRSAGIRARTKRKFKATTNSNHHLPVAANVLNRQFNSLSKPQEVWLTDITYIRTDEGWTYLAVVLDLFTRKVVGWSVDQSMTSQLVVDAMQQAIDRERPEGSVLCHSDRGSQYASNQYQTLLKDNGMTCSMSRRGDFWDNAPMESFFASLKKELVHHEKYKTRTEARRSLFEYIEAFYNTVRKHSALGYQSPALFQQTT